MSWFLLYEMSGWLLRLALIPAVLTPRRTPAAAMAWLSIIFFHPVIGLIFFLLFGSSRLGRRPVRKHVAIHQKLRDDRASRRMHVLPGSEGQTAPVVLQLEKISGMPLLAGNSAQFIADSTAVIDALIKDIDAARVHVHVLVYIFAPDETGKRVIDALMRAAGRGVKCRLLVDAMGSNKLLHARKLIKELKASGVEFTAALPIALLRRKLPRIDFRNHRKLVVIDNAIAYTGSQNIINADYGGRRAGPWYDLMGRLTGPVVADLQVVFLEDWTAETGKQIDSPDVLATPEVTGSVAAQVIDTGPSLTNDSFRRSLIAALNAARHRIITTTPYFVIDEPILLALSMAADRGVEVNIVLPRKSDQRLAEIAGRANFLPLLESGVKIYLYRPGLLHAKTTTVDDALALIGSANLDMRSFNLDFELSVMLYGKEVTAQLREMQMAYIRQSDKVDLAAWRARGEAKQYFERAVALLSPLL
jgi:cardiolipin synthase